MDARERKGDRFVNETYLSRYPVRVIGALVAAALLLASVAFTAGVHADDASTPIAFIASGENHPDALAAGPPAALNTGPVLLTAPDLLPDVTKAELTRLTPDKIVIVGGLLAVSQAVEDELQNYGPIVEPIQGVSPDTDRYTTAAEISKAFFPASLPAGPPGADGKTVLNGAGTPDGGIGVDGDFYIDTDADAIYGPKTAGAWGSSTSLIGPAGANGTDGTDGFGSISFYQREITESLPAFGTSSTGFSADCDPGDSVTGGGYRISSTGAATQSRASGDTWLVSVTMVLAGDVTAYAQCAHVVAPPAP